METIAYKYNLETPQPEVVNQLPSIQENSSPAAAVINLNSNGIYNGTFTTACSSSSNISNSNSNSNSTPRRSRLSLSRIKRERRLKEQEDEEQHAVNALSQVNLNACIEGDDTLQRLGIGISNYKDNADHADNENSNNNYGIHLEENQEKMNRKSSLEINFDLNEMDDSSSSEEDHDDDDDDLCEHKSQLQDILNHPESPTALPSTSKRSQTRIQGRSRNDMVASSGRYHDDGMQHHGTTHSHCKERERIFLDEDSDSDQDFERQTPRSRKRRITICDDDDENDDDDDGHELHFQTDPFQSTFTCTSTGLPSPSRESHDEHCMDNDGFIGLAQQPCTDPTSPLLSPTRDEEVEPPPPEIIVRDGLRTLPIQHRVFSRSLAARKATSPDNDDIEESSGSDSGEDLVILPPSRKRRRMDVPPSLEQPLRREVICLDSDEEEAYGHDGQEMLGTSWLPSWGAPMVHPPVRKHPTSPSLPSVGKGKRATRVSASMTSASTRGRTWMNQRTTSSSNRTSNVRRVSNGAPIQASDLGSNRRDLSGGSGLGLGGFQVRTAYQDDDGEGEADSVASPTTSRRKRTGAASTSKRKASAKGRGSTSSSRSSTKTKAKAKASAKGGRKRKGGGRKVARKGGKRNFRGRSSNAGGAWSANERGIGNYGGARNAFNGEPYMDVKRIDDGLGNAGGASISFE